jgi:Predicted membrane protein (DUF2207)
MLRSCRRFALFPLALVVALLLAALPAVARELVIQQFDETVEVNPNGTIEVTETIEARFTGAWHGIYRTIPVEYDTPQHLNYSLLLESPITKAIR